MHSHVHVTPKDRLKPDVRLMACSNCAILGQGGKPLKSKLLFSHVWNGYNEPSAAQRFNLPFPAGLGSTFYSPERILLMVSPYAICRGPLAT